MRLEAHGLTYQIKERKLINGISTAFQPGALYAVLGPNGSGKSTFFKTLTGIWKPTKGQVTWNQQPLLELSRREVSKIISLVPQNPPLHFDFTVYEMVAMGRYAYGKLTAQDHLIVQKALQQVDAWQLRNSFLSQLSGGERQRIYIARTLAIGAPVLLLDEPAAHLDLRHQLEIWKLLVELVGQGKIVIVALHDLWTAERYCQNVIVFQEGNCIDQGEFSKIMTPSLLQQVFGVKLGVKQRQDFTL